MMCILSMAISTHVGPIREWTADSSVAMNEGTEWWSWSGPNIRWRTLRWWRSVGTRITLSSVSFSSGFPLNCPFRLILTQMLIIWSINDNGFKCMTLNAWSYTFAVYLNFLTEPGIWSHFEPLEDFVQYLAPYRDIVNCDLFPYNFEQRR